MGFRIEQYDDGEAIYIALDPDGVWAQSDFPSELITLDYNAQGGLIGIEMIGSAARRAADALHDALEADANAELKEKLAPAIA